MIDSLEMIKVEGGNFSMGSNDTYAPTCKMTVSIFRIGKFLVTQGAWEDIMKSTPWSDKKFHDRDIKGFVAAKDCPAICISYDDILEFLDRLNGKTKGSYRLPTEAQWEYAYRGGTTTNYFWGNYSKGYEKFAWAKNLLVNSKPVLQPIGQLKPNPLGLYDMAGLVQEWVRDRTTPDGLDPRPGQYPAQGSDFCATEGLSAIIRNASYVGGKAGTHATSKAVRGTDYKDNGLGFRLVQEN